MHLLLFVMLTMAAGTCGSSRSVMLCVIWAPVDCYVTSWTWSIRRWTLNIPITYSETGSKLLLEPQEESVHVLWWTSYVWIFNVHVFISCVISIASYKPFCMIYDWFLQTIQCDCIEDHWKWNTATDTHTVATGKNSCYALPYSTITRL